MKIATANITDFIAKLKSEKKPFTIERTTSTILVRCELGEYFNLEKTGLKFKDLNLIKQVKDYCLNKKIKTNCNKKIISYIQANSVLKNGIYKDVYEIDLNAAYWNFAYKRGFISKDIYLKGLKCSKKGRLVALGNLAKKKIIIEFDGQNFTRCFKEFRSETENIFFKVSSDTDRIMTKCKFVSGSGFLFYWVDAIFLQGEENFRRVCDFLKSEKVDFKTKKLIKIEKRTGYFISYYENLKQKRYIFDKLKKTDLTNLIKIK